jgi:filamentous hemagglutinin family protein
MGRRAAPGTPYARTVAAIAVASCFVAHTALANPTGPTVVNGTAAIHRQGNLLQVTNSPNAILNWQSFSIGANEITRFIQQSQSSAVLNRVTGTSGAIDPSVILGALQSNGRVFLINPSGILFGAGAQIDVAGLVATSLNLSNADFLANRLRFTEAPGAGSVINQGNITTGAGGNVYLVGPAVTNSGLITSPKGEVILAAGASVELVDPGTPNLRVEISASEHQAKNLGGIIADSGRIGIYAGLINHSGTIRADSVVNEGGRILLKATKSATLEAGSVTTASGPAGGNITVQAAATTLVAGTIQAKGTEDKGGTVQLLGNLVGLIENASVDVSGNTGGGTVQVGGDFQGKPALSAVEGNPIQNAFRTYFGPDATIKADAVTSGDGGKVIVWSDDATRAYGTISARGGSQGGNGGFVEVSGKRNLEFDARVDASAPHGTTGTLLLDPLDITISDTVGTDNNQLNAGVPTGGDPTGSVFFADGSTATNVTISDDAIELQTANIVLQASRDITVNSNLSGGGLVLTTPAQRLTMQAGRHITIGSPITTTGGAIILEADSPHAPTSTSTDGRKPADGIGQLSIQQALNSGGGAITLIGGGNPIRGLNNQNLSSTRGGIELEATVDAGAGEINVALSGNAPLGIGVTGQLTHILGSPIANLKTTGTLVLGTATTGGTDGQGAGAQTLTADSISNIYNGSAIALSPASGSSFQLIAGSGGILLSQPLATFQSTTISTAGQLTINQTVSTSNHNLTINAGSVTIGSSGTLNYGSGIYTCTVVTGVCPGGGNQVFWDGGAGTLNWFDANNWSTDLVPAAAQNVTISSGVGTIVVNGTAQANSLVADRPVLVSSGQSLTLANASIFSDGFTFSGGSLLGTGDVTVDGANGVLTWNGGTMAGSGTFLLASGHNGTLSGSLTLDRLFQNSGTLTLSGATINGTGSITNGGLVTVASSTSNVVNTLISNKVVEPTLGTMTLGTIQVNGLLTAANFPTNDGTINIASGATLSTSNASLTNEATGIIQASGTVDLGSGSFNNSGSATFNGAYSVPTTTVSAGAVTFNGTASTGTLALSGGAVDGTGSLTVTTDYNQTGGSLGTTFTDLALTKSGNFNVGGFTATNSVRLTSTGAITLNGAVSAAGAGDAVVLAGTGFTNNVGASALSTPNGRWLVYSTDPSAVGEGRGGLIYDFKQYNATYGVTPVASASGNGFLYSVAPAITPRLTGTTSKVYDGTTTASLAPAHYATTGAIDGDTVTLSNPATGAYADKNVGTGKSVSATVAIASASDGAAAVYGYQLSSTTASGNIGDLTPATLAYLANTASRERGDPNPVFGGAVSGFVGGETLATATTGTPSFTSPATQSSVEGQYAINGSGLTALNGNYTFVQAPANTTALTVTAPVNFSWTSNTGGAWESGPNWNKGFAPVDGAVVTIPDLGPAGPSAIITYSSATTNVKTLTSFEGLAIAGGTLNLGTGGVELSTFQVGAPVTLTGGTLGINSGAALSVSNLSINGGMLHGTGTIIGNVNNVAGTVAPGMSAGVLTINGNYMQGSGGTLAVELGGTAAGTQYDRLVVTGNSTLGGTLSATLVNGFVPANAEAFTIVQSGGTVNGTFAATNLPSTPSFSTNYLVSSVNVTTGGALVPLLAVVDTTTQIVVVATDQSTTSPATTAPPPDEKKDKEKGVQKKPMCTGGSSGGGGGGVAVTGGGGRCTTRGCT